MYGYFVCIYVRVPWAHMPLKSIKGHLIPCDWSYKWLWVTKWVLENEPKFSRKATSACNHWAFAPVPSSHVLMPVIHQLWLEQSDYKEVQIFKYLWFKMQRFLLDSWCLSWLCRISLFPWYMEFLFLFLTNHLITVPRVCHYILMKNNLKERRNMIYFKLYTWNMITPDKEH